jgi:ABC-type nitrate/sulfonate/bicarbonate transport system substrate-binding protein
LYPTFPGQGLVVRRSVLAEKRAELAGWLQALEQARAWMTANGAAAAEFLVSEGVPAKVAQVLVQGAPNALVPDQAGVELLIKQRERLYPNDIEGVSYQTLVDNGLLLNVN